ncbi:cytochrome c biogenesis protein CcsA [Aquihabitans sp. G128]|uniref:cytochrome c biogenesis protein CcsA n=1 Tax=Aquihabitans sp. G128 TaxID=2849779 RepID=UPI001C235DDB|nr:cytochrome c biogenesis protein CcsA [Aquihabitans sp. G128]QXC60946.1 cytochrome c biogenesis protein CcsA [Aquihabitans sp. G128]
MNTTTGGPLEDRETGSGAGLLRVHPDGTASPGSRRFGIVLSVSVVVFLAVALVISPPDSGAGASENAMGEMVRIMYVHVPVANACYLAFFMTALASVMYLWKKTEGWDSLAAASAEVGVVFTALTLATGSIWGKIAWGTWWEWDARLTSTLLMLVVYIGYLALRRAILDPVVRAKRAAIVGLVAFANVPIVHYSVTWWRGLHQEATISRFDPTIDGGKLFALMFGLLLGVALYVWLMIHRFRLQYAEARLESKGLDVALAERRAEAVADRPQAGAPLAAAAQKGTNP